MDHMRSGRIDFDRLEVLILDEADRMLDMGFIDDIETIVAATPQIAKPCFSPPLGTCSNVCFFHPNFNSQPREGGWQGAGDARCGGGQFQLTAARRRLATKYPAGASSKSFQLTAARRRLVCGLR